MSCVSKKLNETKEKAHDHACCFAPPKRRGSQNHRRLLERNVIEEADKDYLASGILHRRVGRVTFVGPIEP